MLLRFLIHPVGDVVEVLVAIPFGDPAEVVGDVPAVLQLSLFVPSLPVEGVTAAELRGRSERRRGRSSVSRMSVEVSAGPRRTS
jgi:hypothetical protein